MGVNGAELLQQYIPKENGSSGSGGQNFMQFTQQTWAAGGVFVDAKATEEQKIEAAATTLTSLLALFGANEAGAAEQETKANEEAASELDKTIQTTTNNTNNIVNEQIAKIQEIAAKIQERLEQLEESNEQKQENQKKLEEHLITIEDCKLILQDPKRTSSERKIAIDKLKGASEGIAEIATFIEKLQVSSEEANNEVETLNSNQTDINANIDNTIQDGNNQLTTAATQVVAEQGKNAVTATKGGINETQSAAAIAAIATLEAASNVPLVGSFVSAASRAMIQKLEGVASDQGQAGTTRLPSAAATQIKLSASEATRQASLTMFSNIYSYAMGQSDEASLISNTFYSFMEPIGAWIEDANNVDFNKQCEALNSAIEDVSGQVEQQGQGEEQQSDITDNQGSEDNGSSVELKFETDEIKGLLG